MTTGTPVTMMCTYRANPGKEDELFALVRKQTTRHVRLLESAGLLEQSKDGRRRLYRVNRDKLQLIRTWLQWFFEDAANPR